MKYIKLFENFSHEGDILDYGKDILLDLSDDGINVVAYSHDIDIYFKIGDVSDLVGPDRTALNLKKYIDSFKHLFSYINGAGYKLYKASFWLIKAGDNLCIEDDEEFFDYISGSRNIAPYYNPQGEYNELYLVFRKI